MSFTIEHDSGGKRHLTWIRTRMVGSNRLDKLRHRVGELLVESQRKSINTSSTQNGMPFKPLKPGTIKQKRALGSPWPRTPLRRFGAGRESIRYKLHYAKAVKAGPTLDYMAAQNSGFGKVPARPFIPLREEYKTRIAYIVAAWSARQLDESRRAAQGGGRRGR